MINLFKNENEQTVKFFSMTRGHNKGEIENINLLITTHGIYVLIKNDQETIDDMKVVRKNPANNENIYRKEMQLSHSQLDYIEVGLEAQVIHIVCTNKRSSFWLTTASRYLTE
jgi:hypothetical protein